MSKFRARPNAGWADTAGLAAGRGHGAERLLVEFPFPLCRVKLLIAAVDLDTHG